MKQRLGLFLAVFLQACGVLSLLISQKQLTAALIIGTGFGILLTVGASKTFSAWKAEQKLTKIT